MDIGIDLGTTFSVMAVKGQVEMVDNYPPGYYLEECDVTLIPSPEGDLLIPSVLWWDPDDPENYIVGMEAKLLAEQGKSPIMFSKRAIGTTEKLMMNGREFSAKEVATHILKYLKSCAQDALGKAVHRAVVTHPAHFGPNAVHETRQAAIDAGFDMSLPQQMLMEPCAAAYAYTLENERDPLRVLAYDLGGGTFDVAVLEKRLGDIQMKRFDGDDLLGGYNFDKTFVQWVKTEIEKQGRHLLFDPNSPDDCGKYARLMQIAEQIKEALSQQRTSKVFVPVKFSFLEDDQGKPIQFVGRINREKYAELVKDDLDTTINICCRALEDSKMTVEDLHAIMLVGGSTYGQWVQDAVRNSFGIEPEIYNPDHCVAAGAAIVASQLPVLEIGPQINLLLDINPTCVLPLLNVKGKIEPSQDSGFNAESCKKMLIILDTPEGNSIGPAEIQDDGSFIFPDIELLDEGEASEYTIHVYNNDQEITHKSFTVTYNPEDPGKRPFDIPLPRPLYIKTAEGNVPLAEEGKYLPVKCKVQQKKLFDDSTVTIPVLLDEEEVGAIRIDNIPEEAGAGSLVIVDVEVTQNNVIRGTVQVKTRSGTVAKEGPVQITFPSFRIPDLAELKNTTDELKDRLEMELLNSNDQSHRLALQGKGRRLIGKIEQLFSDLQPDKQIIYRTIKELEHIVNPPDDDMDPSHATFRQRLEYCREIISNHSNDPGVMAYQPRIDKIDQDGTKAYSDKNKRKWSNINEALLELMARLKKVADPGPQGSPPLDLDPPAVQKEGARMHVDDIRMSLKLIRQDVEKDPDYFTRWQKRCDTVDNDLNIIEKAIDKIDDSISPEQCQGKIRLALMSMPKIIKAIDLIKRRVDIGEN